MAQVCMLIFYVNFAYIQNQTYDYQKKEYGKNPAALILLIGLVYPIGYESV